MGWRTLSENDLLTADPVLAARIRGRGVATHSYVAPDPDLLDSIAVFDVAHRVAIVSPRRVLSIVDLQDATSIEVDRSLTFPSLLRTSGARIAYVRKAATEFAVAVASVDGTSRELLRLRAVPVALEFDGTHVYVLDADGELSAARADDLVPSLKPIATAVADVGIGPAGLFVCTTAGRLQHVDRGATNDMRRSCVPRTGIQVADDNVLVVSGADTIDVFDRTQGRRITLRDAARARLALSADGHVAAISADGIALALRPDRDNFDAVDVGRRYPTAVGAVHGHLAWGFGEGDTLVQELNGATWWTYGAHSRGINAVVIDRGAQSLLTWSANELREWRRPREVAEVLVAGTGIPFNAIPSADRSRFVLDGATGQASILSISGKGAAMNPIHRHHDLAFGAAWCGPLACTAGWDKRVICSDPATGERRTELTARGAIRWITPLADKGTCVVASADGRVSRLDTREVVYLSPFEPHRVREIGRRVVSTRSPGGSEERGTRFAA